MLFSFYRLVLIESILVKKKNEKKREKQGRGKSTRVQVREIAISSTTFEKIAPRLFWPIPRILVVFTSFRKMLVHLISVT